MKGISIYEEDIDRIVKVSQEGDREKEMMPLHILMH